MREINNTLTVLDGIYVLRGSTGTLYDRRRLEGNLNEIGLNADKEDTYSDEEIANSVLEYWHQKDLDESLTDSEQESMGAITGLAGILGYSEPDEVVYLGKNHGNPVWIIGGKRFQAYNLRALKETDRVVTHEEAINLAEEYSENEHCKPVKEVTEENFNEALGCLPPERWSNGVFYMMEAYTGYLHSMYCQIENRFFTAIRNVKKVSNNDFRQECLEFIEAHPTRQIKEEVAS